GVVHNAEIILPAGEHEIVVGSGGAVGEDGAETMAFNLVAYGGGHGGWYDGVKAAGDGASGGGAAIYSGAADGAKAIYAEEGNLGHAGGGSVHLYGAGGGGGAGGPGETATGSLPGAGGIGYCCDITGTATYYAGGGGGYRLNVTTKGGLGGGGDGGVAGTPGTGGGGGGNAAGGSGIVIVRYKAPPSGMTITVR
ncbi:MAG: hypothetical protein IJG13_08955, partial [Kiritimatiellae bacterium]|nr:hypothetical protein [Kiritimatiellia bacterium]